MDQGAPDFREFCRCWLRLGCAGPLGPGGSDGWTDRMRGELVARLGWVPERVFLRGRELCALLPGSGAHQLAVYLGWRLLGARGGVAAGLGLLLPSAVLLLPLSWLAVSQAASPLAAGALRGLAGAVAAVAARAAWRMARGSLRHPLLYGFAAASFLMGFALRLKFLGIVVAAGLMGLWLGMVRPDIFCPGPARLQAVDEAGPDGPDSPAPRSLRHLARVGGAGLGLWLAAALPAMLLSGPGGILTRLLDFHLRAGLFAFGGAWGVLSYTQDMAMRLGWLGQAQLAHGLGLAGSAPGPLAMFALHTGFATAWGQPGALSPLAAGALGGLLAAFGLFLPGFLLVLAAAPHGEALLANRWLRALSTGVSAALVGVLLKVGALLALAAFWPLGLSGPPDVLALAVAGAGGLLLWRGWAGTRALVLAAAALGAAWSFLG